MSTINTFADLENLRSELFGGADEAPETPETPVAEVTENVEEVAEKPEEVDEVTSEVTEPTEEESDEPKPDVKPEPKNRANERIRELNEKAKTEKARADHLEQEIGRIRERQAELDKLTEGAEVDLDPNKFESMDAYIKAVTDAKVAKAVEARDRQQLEQESAKTIQAYEQSIAKSFEANIAQYAEVNPNITAAVEHLNKYAEHIPPEVRLALLTDENGAKIAWDIATSSELLESVIRGNPAQSIKLIGKLSAKHDGIQAPTSAPVQSASKVEAFTPKGTPVASKPKVPEVPRVAGSTATSTDKLSPKEAWEQFKAGKIKRPF